MDPNAKRNRFLKRLLKSCRFYENIKSPKETIDFDPQMDTKILKNINYKEASPKGVKKDPKVFDAYLRCPFNGY